MVAKHDLNAILFVFFEVRKNPFSPCIWVSKLLWDLDLLEELWCTNWSLEVRINDTLDVFLFILIEVREDPFFPCFWISKLLRDFPFLKVEVWPSIV